MCTRVLFLDLVHGRPVFQLFPYFKSLLFYENFYQILLLFLFTSRFFVEFQICSRMCKLCKHRLIKGKPIDFVFAVDSGFCKICVQCETLKTLFKSVGRFGFERMIL